MCEFVSWIEKNKEVFFLTMKDIESKRGKELRDYCQNDDDLTGHGAIRWFCNIQGGKERECTDFSSPKNFPPVIVAAIKAGKFSRWFGPVPSGILRAPLDADYEAKRDALYADYEAKRDALYADYKAKRAPLDADYEAKRDALYADYKAKRAPLDADYEAKRDALDAEAWHDVTKKKNRSDAWK